MTNLVHGIIILFEPVGTRHAVSLLGFKKEGFSPKYLKINNKWRDHERWAILKEDFHL
jgi:RimJ/RimL family protein N-acetyltransferase